MLTSIIILAVCVPLHIYWIVQVYRRLSRPGNTNTFRQLLVVLGVTS